MMCVRVVKQHSIVFYSTIRYNTYNLKRHNDSQDMTPEDTVPVFKYSDEWMNWTSQITNHNIRFILSVNRYD